MIKGDKWARFGEVNGHYKHGKRNTRLFRIWSNMKSRCYNSNFPDYKNYGMRGISICDEWINDFMSFHTWAIDNGYKENLTIDRIDVNGDYCPKNCRWVTLYQQSINKRTNHFVVLNGVRKTLQEWCDEFGINRKTVCDRLRRGWDIQTALTKEVDRRWSRSHG